jgi:ADP-ribose pyrophosphatase YjhB (NUDIX family)
MSKPVKYVVAVILNNNLQPDEFLLVKRPDDDPDLRGAWGLPAVTLKPGELPEAGALRTCQEKLHCEARAERLLGAMFQKRNSYDIFLMDIEMRLLGERQPDVARAKSDHTVYTKQKWTTDASMLMPAAKNGSCCASIFLTDRGLLDREAWIASLEGSDLVS